MILPSSRSPRPRPPTSTRSSPNATAKPPPWSPPTATPVKRTCSREPVAGSAETAQVQERWTGLPAGFCSAHGGGQPAGIDAVGKVDHDAFGVHAERGGHEFGVHAVDQVDQPGA